MDQHPHRTRPNIWELPIGKGKTFLNRIPGWANYIVGNWKWSGVGSLTSGFPFQLYLGNNAGYPDDVSRIRVNTKSGVTNYILPGWKENCNNPVTQRCPYVDALNSFSPPSFMTIGSAARVVDYIRMPHVRTFDTSFLKEFPIHEQIKLAFRAELYGALNHVYFQSNANNFTVFQNLDYSKGGVPSVTQANVAPAFGDVGSNIGGLRRIQLGLKLYF